MTIPEYGLDHEEEMELLATDPNFAAYTLSGLRDAHQRVIELTANTYTVVQWPESQNYMELPDAILIVDPKPFGPSAYMVPTHLLEEV